MAEHALTVALVGNTFHEDPEGASLRSRLQEARARGAELAVLPELPLNPWAPIHRAARPEDAEPPGGPRQRLQAESARAAGIALLGGAIVRDPTTGARHNTAILWGPDGSELGRYRKLHLPEEEGFWETSHYEPGDRLPELWTVAGTPLGVQICSDANRPQGSHLLGAAGAEVLLVPRATPSETWARWLLVLRANAVTSAAYLISVNRPPEDGTMIGGPSVAIAPDGAVLHESDDPLAVVRLDRTAVVRARTNYPGYLPVRAELYASGWSGIAP